MIFFLSFCIFLCVCEKEREVSKKQVFLRDELFLGFQLRSQEGAANWNHQKILPKMDIYLSG